jgi:hypothetical protein
MNNPGGSLADLRNFATNTANIDELITLDVSDIGSGNGTRNIDMDLLANPNKISNSPKTPTVTAQPYSSFGSTFQISNPPPSQPAQNTQGIEFVNIEDTQKKISFSSADTGLKGIDSIHINRGSSDFGSVNLEPINLDAAPLSTDPIMGGTTNEVAPSVPAGPKLTPEQEATEKSALLTKMRRLATKGVVGNAMNMSNTLDEIKAEYSRLVDSAGLEKSIKFQRNLLVTCVTGMEFLNQKFNPVDVNLDGWSESVNENQEDYDEIFEELYDKYKDRAKVAPEIRLLMTLGISASMTHLTNTFFKSKMPGMDDILKQNPDLARQFANAAAQKVGPGFANFMSMGQPQRPNSQNQNQNQGMGMGQEPSPYNNGVPENTGTWNPELASAPPSPSVNNAQTARREMRGPSGVEDILKAFEQEDRQSVGGGSQPSGFNPPSRPELNNTNDDGQSIFTSTTMNGSEAAARKSGRGGKRKPATAPVGNSINLIV